MNNEIFTSRDHILTFISCMLHKMFIKTKYKNDNIWKEIICVKDIECKKVRKIQIIKRLRTKSVRFVEKVSESCKR